MEKFLNCCKEDIEEKILGFNNLGKDLMETEIELNNTSSKVILIKKNK